MIFLPTTASSRLISPVFRTNRFLMVSKVVRVVDLLVSILKNMYELAKLVSAVFRFFLSFWRSLLKCKK